VFLAVYAQLQCCCVEEVAQTNACTTKHRKTKLGESKTGSEIVRPEGALQAGYRSLVRRVIYPKGHLSETYRHRHRVRVRVRVRFSGKFRNLHNSILDK